VRRIGLADWVAQRKEDFRKIFSLRDLIRKVVCWYQLKASRPDSYVICQCFAEFGVSQTSLRNFKQFCQATFVCVGSDSVVGIENRYGLDGPGIESKPIPVAEPSKERVCGRSLAGVTGLNPTGCMNVCVMCVVQ
jgi:hypothetical protein